MRAPASPLVRRCFVPLCSVLLTAHAAAQGGIQKLFASDAAPSREFGRSGLAIDRGRLVVGATRPGNAAAYVFEPLEGVWTEVAKLERIHPPGAFDAFATAIDVDGDRIVIGGPGLPLTSSPGLLYVFERRPAGWAESARLVAPGGTPRDRFGISVALEDDLLVVGAPGDDRFGQDAGAAFVFRFRGGSVGQDGWELVQVLEPPAASGPVQFGTSVALSEGRILVGAPSDEKGKACFFRPVAGGWVLEQSISFASSHGHPGDAFGTSVCLDGDQAAVGAPFHGCNSGCGPLHLNDRAGVVVVFQRADDGWHQERELIGDNNFLDLRDRWMGESVALSSGMVLAGCPYRSVTFVFRLWIGNSIPARKGHGLYAGTATIDSGERYGEAVALDENWIVIGVGGDDERAPNAGAVYVQRRETGAPPFCCKMIGEYYCSPPYFWGLLLVDGSEDTSDDSLLLHVGSVPFQSYGFFMMARERASIDVPGQYGPLCLGGPDGILRLSQQPLQDYSDEIISQTVGTRSVPGLATGIVPGSTWHFQAWFGGRFQNQGFSNAVSVTFR